MHFSTLAAFSVLAFVPAVVATQLEQAVYWGQYGPGEANLTSVCAPDSGVTIVPLAFLYQYGSPNPLGGTLGNCNISIPLPAEMSPACAEVAAAVKYCQSQGKTVLLSIGGGGGSGSVSSQQDAESVAEDIWAQYGPIQKGYTGPRPLGDAILDGFDLDIENQMGAYNYIFMIWKFRELFATDPGRKYYITGAPQCVVPDASMGDMIFNAPFDYLFVQFYNTPTCSARGRISGYPPADGRNQYFSFDAWRQWTGVQSSQSRTAKLLIGLPSSVDAADNDEPYYLKPTEALQLINEYRYSDGFAGVMLWDAGNSAHNVIDGCTYAQQISSILLRGRTC